MKNKAFKLDISIVFDSLSTIDFDFIFMEIIDKINEENVSEHKDKNYSFKLEKIKFK